ncbi:hypothetical protein SAMN05216404_12223 [Nitrosospira multiformis]|uniref:Uncharacterized protein n=1 Tax=Nitrosospira multiformis TaxID=1231 RepID=A0A1H8PR28_9PROT|nr:hypothetical protein SAMN05216404_12223 [Nitrosospira multiformis]
MLPINAEAQAGRLTVALIIRSCGITVWFNINSFVVSGTYLNHVIASHSLMSRQRLHNSGEKDRRIEVVPLR